MMKLTIIYSCIIVLLLCLAMNDGFLIRKSSLAVENISVSSEPDSTPKAEVKTAPPVVPAVPKPNPPPAVQVKEKDGPIAPLPLNEPAKSEKKDTKTDDTKKLPATETDVKTATGATNPTENIIPETKTEKKEESKEPAEKKDAKGGETAAEKKPDIETKEPVKEPSKEKETDKEKKGDAKGK
eukprot:Platyproteum_vivax@DN5310_c0_g1_i1.p2